MFLSEKKRKLKHSKSINAETTPLQVVGVVVGDEPYKLPIQRFCICCFHFPVEVRATVAVVHDLH